MSNRTILDKGEGLDYENRKAFLWSTLIEVSKTPQDCHGHDRHFSCAKQIPDEIILRDSVFSLPFNLIKDAIDIQRLSPTRQKTGSSSTIHF